MSEAFNVADIFGRMFLMTLLCRNACPKRYTEI